MKKINISIITTTLLLGSSLYGVTPPSSSDILRQAEPIKVEKEKSTLPELKEVSYKAPIVADKGLKIGVKNFTISQNSAISEAELLGLIKEYEGKELTLNELNDVASIITKHYRNQDYFVARAYIPAQELSKTDATVEIAVIEGLYGNFTVKNSSLVKDEVVQGFMDKLTSGEVISTKSLERQMMLVDDLGGVQITSVDILPGSEVGKSDFTLTSESEAKYYGYAIADNYGSRYTGEYRLNVAGYVNSLSGKGDVLGISALGSHTGNMANGRVSYSTPLGYNGLSLDSSLSYTTYDIAKEFTKLEISGESTLFDIGVKYPFIKSRNHTLETSLTYAYKDATDEDNYRADRNKKVNSLKVELSDSFKTTNGVLDSSIAITSGDVALGDYAKSIDTIGADGKYTKLNFSLGYTKALPKNFSLSTTLSGQTSLQSNLDGGEDFSVGGVNGVRAYTDSELSGDKGYLASLELSYKLSPIKGINHSLSTFIDHAKVWDNKEAVSGVNSEARLLSDAGIGYNLSYKDVSIKASYAHGFGGEKTPTGDGSNTNLNRAFIQAMMRF
jgi:hemolysin activation/secretion protein